MIRRSVLRSLSHNGTKSYLSSLTALDPVQEALLSEPCILVDKKDKPIGTASKRECHAMKEGSSLLHRAFSLFIFNERNELLLQQRSDTKITFPSLWTNTCCSHPLAISTEVEEFDALGVRRAAQRRVEIELGVKNSDAKIEDIMYLTRILYSAPSSGQWGENELDYILFLRSNKSLQLDPNPDEVKSIEWVSKRHLHEFLQNLEHQGVGITPWFRLISKNLLPMWWDNIHRIHEMKDHQTIHEY